MFIQRTVALCVTLLCIAPEAVAAPVPCAGGTIDFTATSYDGTPQTTFNVGQFVQLTALPAGIAPASYSWTIDGPKIKDYDERVGTNATGAIAWSVTPLTAADQSAPDVSFYWKPDPSQIHPLNAGAVSRNVTLQVMIGSTPCTNVQTFSVERNNSNIDRQVEDFYVANHRDPSETDLQHGRVIDDHVEWHTDFASNLYTFLPWHHEFLGRFDRFRAEFGYPPSLTWSPGNAIPTGIEIDDVTRSGWFIPGIAAIPVELTITGGNSSTNPTQKRLADWALFDDMEHAVESPWHGNVHIIVGGIMGTLESPKDPLFYRWHGFVDHIYKNYCSMKALPCSSIAPSPSDLWMADNATDLGGNGAEPSSGVMWMSPSVWNRTVTATCTPPSPVAGVSRTCGSAADHEDPVSGVQNYLYATVRNDRPGAKEIEYLEVGVFIGEASTGLSWPASFGGDPLGALRETRQFITVNVPAGQVTDVGPLEWTPPTIAPGGSDHWCLYVRARTEQSPFAVAEGTEINTNTANNNNIVWRNVKIVNNSTDSVTFKAAHTQGGGKASLRIEVPPAFLTAGTVRLLAPRNVVNAAANGQLSGLVRDGDVRPDPALRARLQRVTLPDRVPSNATPRVRELVTRARALRDEVSSCAGRPAELSLIERLRELLRRLGGGTSGKTDERSLLAALSELEKIQRACLRGTLGLSALKLTGPTATFDDVELTGSAGLPVTLEFSNDSGARGEHQVIVSQIENGRVVGGNTYLVRTGSH